MTTADSGAASAARRLTTALSLDGQHLTSQEFIDRAIIADEVGVPSLWAAQLPNQRDSMTLLAAAAVQTSRLRLGAGVVPTYTRPPVALAQEAATLDELSAGRFTVGVGSGHPLMATWMDGRSTGSVSTFLRDYCAILTALLSGEEAHVEGPAYRAHARLGLASDPRTPVMLGAFGPRMSQQAAATCDGLLLWMCGPQYVEEVVLPAVRAGLAQRTDGRFRTEEFPIVAFVPGGVSADVDADREILAHYLAAYARIPHYNTMYVRSGLDPRVEAGKVDASVVEAITAFGSEERVRERIATFHDAGATCVGVAPMGGAFFDPDLFRRTATLLASVAQEFE